MDAKSVAIKEMDELRAAFAEGSVMMRVQWEGGEIVYMSVDDYVKLSAKDLEKASVKLMRLGSSR